MSNWKIIVAMATENYILNSSFENGTTNWTTSGTNTIAASLLQQKFGTYSCLVTYGNNSDLLAQSKTMPTTSTDYYLSAWVYVPTGYDGTVLRLEATSYSGSSEVYTTVFTVGTDDFDKWIRISTVVTLASDVAGSIRLFDTGSPTAAKTLYVDALQFEETTALTTFCDGDQPGCEWRGEAYTTRATRSLSTRLGGVLKDLDDDYGLPVERMIGTGATAMNTVSTPRALLPGDQWQRSVARTRVFSLVCTFRGSDLTNYHALRQDLMAAISPDGIGTSDPVILRYTGAAVDKEIEARYIGGLEMAGPRGFAETVALRFQADDPFFRQIGNNARGMFTQTGTYRIIASRIDGVWSNMGPPHASGSYNIVYDIAVHPHNGKVYVCGDFLNFDNIGTADWIVEWDPETETWAALAETSTGLTGVCRGLAFSPAGILYAVGDFFNADGVAAADYIAQWDGTGWTAVGDPASGATINTIATCFWGRDDKLYVGGFFTNLAGNALCDHLAVWDGSTWSDVDAGTTDEVRVIDQGKDLSLYIGGDFTTVGPAGDPVSANRIAKFVKGESWAALDVGFTNRVRGLSIDESKGVVYAFGDFGTSGSTVVTRSAVFKGQWRPMGEGMNAAPYSAFTTHQGQILIGGAFTEVDGIDTPDGIALWNGSAFLPLDLSLAGTPTIWATLSVPGALRAVPGETRRRGEDFYIGGDFDGETGTYPLKTTTVTNGGTARVYPIVKISRSGGTSSRVSKLTNTTTDKSVYLNYSLQDGETVTLDFRPGHLSMTSDAGRVLSTNRWDILPQSILADFYLLPGINGFTIFYDALGGATVTAIISWSDTYWSVD